MAKRVVIDLEMCNVPQIYRNKNYSLSKEIIQIGAVLMDENNNINDEFSQFVKPDYGVVDNFIKSLTGIREANVRKAKPLGVVVREMLAWIGTEDINFYSWSDNDYRQFKKELQAKEIESDDFVPLLNEKNWIDFQQVFDKRFKFGKSLSLKDALFYLEIDPEGRLHDGLADARNTARMIAKMEKYPDKLFLLDTVRKNEQEAVSIGTNLGCLLQGLRTQIA